MTIMCLRNVLAWCLVSQNNDLNLHTLKYLSISCMCRKKVQIATTNADSENPEVAPHNYISLGLVSTNYEVYSRKVWMLTIV